MDDKKLEVKKPIIGVTFEGMDKFSLDDLTDIKKLVNRTKMTIDGFRSVMGKVRSVYHVNAQIAFFATQYCVINRDS